jgi:hypothetical protein
MKAGGLTEQAMSQQEILLSLPEILLSLPDWLFQSL